MPEPSSVKAFQDQDVIFQEGDASTFAYVVVKGRVDLFKSSKFGQVRLASLKAGELFGEMGLIDGSPRSATARAIGPTTLREIPPSDFMDGVKNDPKISSKVMGKLVERLRSADEMLAKAGLSSSSGTGTNLSTATKPASKIKKPGFLSRLFGGTKGRTRTFEILLADFFDDVDPSITAHYFETLTKTFESWGFNEVSVRRANSPFALPDFSDSPVNWEQIRTGATSWLKEEEADLLVWGQARNNGQMVHLRFAHCHPRQDLRAGYVDSCDALDLPSDLDDVLSGFLSASVLCAIVPFEKKQSDIFSEMAPIGLESMRPAVNMRLRDLGVDEKLRFDMAYANALATTALFTKNPSLLREAEDTLLKSEINLRRCKSALLPGIQKRHLGLVRHAWADMGGSNDLLEASIESYEEAAQHFTQQAFPMEWGDLQTMQGQLLYKLDQSDPDGKALDRAISAYQNALKVFSAAATPKRWGDAKHHLARALQLLGSQRGDLQLIARAAEACREALSVRSKTQTPMLWAATQNNLGSALFMLCQKTRKPETADAAVRAFEAACEVYEARRVERLLAVTRKNLMRAHAILEDIGPLSTKAAPEPETALPDTEEMPQEIEETPDETDPSEEKETRS